LPSSVHPLPWFPRASEFSPRFPRALMACALPVHPSAFRARILGSSGAKRPGGFPPAASSLALRRHLSVLPPSFAVTLRGALVDVGEPLSNHASLELACPSAYQGRGALFLAPQAREASGKRCPASRKSRPQGLATLPAVSAPPDPWEPLSAPDARGLRPSELSSSPVIGKKVSLPLLPPRLFPAKPSRPGGGAWAA
jgi:hypothetical protein